MDDKHRKRLCIIPEFMRPEGEHKRWNEHLPVYYRTGSVEIASATAVNWEDSGYEITRSQCARIAVFYSEDQGDIR